MRAVEPLWTYFPGVGGTLPFPAYRAPRRNQ